MQANDQFLQSCRTFAQGGEWDEVEHDAAEERLREEDKKAREAQEQWRQLASELGERQQAQQGHMDAFLEASKTAQKELCMKYGLGKRFGAPRRACMGRVRSLFGENAVEKDRIQGRLEELELLVRHGEPGVPPVWILPGGGVD